MCFPAKKDHKKDKRHKKKERRHQEQPVPHGGAHGGHGGGAGGGESSKEPEEDLTVAEAPDQMPECDLEPFSWRRQHFTADQMM